MRIVGRNEGTGGSVRAILAAAALAGAVLASGCVSQDAYDTARRRTVDLEQQVKDLDRANAELQVLASKAALTEVEKKELARLRHSLRWQLHDFPENMVEGDRLVISDVSFRPGAVTLSEKGMKTLDHVAEVLTKKIDLGRLAIEGHSDNQPLMPK